MCKVCPSCGVEKDLAEFFRDKSKPLGVGTYCKPCDKSRSKKWASNNRVRSNEIKKGYVDRNPELRKAQALKWRWSNLEYSREAARDWGKRNQAKKNHHTAKYRANKRLATPKWLSAEQLEDIEMLYVFCELFEGYEVDHIVPLVHPQVHGLHVPWNLQILPATENRRKSNRFTA